MSAWIEKWWGLVALLVIVPSGFVWALSDSVWGDAAAVINSLGCLAFISFIFLRADSSNGSGNAGTGGANFIGEPDQPQHSGIGRSITQWISNYFGPGNGGGGPDGSGGHGHGGHGHGGGFDGGGHGGGGHGGGHG